MYISCRTNTLFQPPPSYSNRMLSYTWHFCAYKLKGFLEIFLPTISLLVSGSVYSETPTLSSASRPAKRWPIPIVRISECLLTVKGYSFVRSLMIKAWLYNKDLYTRSPGRMAARRGCGADVYGLPARYHPHLIFSSSNIIPGGRIFVFRP